MKDVRDYTPLLHAYENEAIIELLLSKGADTIMASFLYELFNIKNHKCEGILYIVVKKRHIGNVNSLLENGSDTFITDKKGCTPLNTPENFKYKPIEIILY